MGYYLNSSQVYSLYENETKKPYFVDKTDMLRVLIPLVEEGNNHVCITRPRRFGKSVMAAMVGAFFSREMDSSSIFDTLNIAKSDIDISADTLKAESGTDEQSADAMDGLLSHVAQTGSFDYRKYMNHYNVIYINFLNSANLCNSYEEFIKSIERFITRDLRKKYPKVDYWKGLSVPDYLGMIHEETKETFILVLDEWDCIFHKTYTTNEDRRSFINWLAAMTKDKGYVSLSYMTGVLPIAKYSSGSTINNFHEYTMATDDIFCDYFGFTEAEVDELYARYEVRTSNPNISREDLKLWYDGYHTPSSGRMYNPRSVVEALNRNRIRSYWSSTGTYGEIAAYIKNDYADIRKDVALMVSGEAVPADVEEYAATTMQLTTRTELLSAMVVYGFLNYEDGKVHIPNKELMDEFAKTIREKQDLGYIHRLAVESDRMLEATYKVDENESPLCGETAEFT